MSVNKIRAALDTIDATPRHGFLEEIEQQLVTAWIDNTQLDVTDVATDLHHPSPHARHPGLRWILAAAATIVVFAFGLFALVAVQDPGSVQTNTVPPTPVPSTTPATAPSVLPLDSSPTLPATTTGTNPSLLPVDPSSDTLATSTHLAPPPGEEVTVAADLVDFGDDLVGLIGNMDRADGRTYVIAGRYESEGDLLMPPREAVLAAFDEVGTELWRTDLDGTPVEVVAFAGDVWVLHEFGMTGALSHIDASNGRLVGHLAVGNVTGLTAEFGSMWVQIGDSPRSAQLVRVDADMSTTTVELPDRVFSEDDDPWPDGAAAGPDAIWVPLGKGGVAVVDPDSLGATVIPVDVIGHDVLKVGFDGDVTYVASRNRVTAIIDGKVQSTVAPGQFAGGTVISSDILYVGPIDGLFGVQLPDGWFAVLRADAPMVVEYRRLNTSAIASEIDGQGWVETGRNYNLRRVEFLPIADGGE